MIDPSLKKFVPLKNRTELVLVGKFVTEVEPARAMQLGTHLPQLKTLYDQRYGFLGRHSSLFLSHQSPFFHLHHFLKRTSDIFFICIIFKMESPGGHWRPPGAIAGETTGGGGTAWALLSNLQLLPRRDNIGDVGL